MRKTSIQRACLGACAGALAALALGGGPALAQSGGVSGGATGTTGVAADGTYYPYWFGARELRLGNAGEDVKTLNWLLRGLALGTPYDGSFQAPTESAVRSLQAQAGLPSDGVVRRSTRKQIAARMSSRHASYYGPGLYGNGTACGRTLTPKTIGVAHKKLPCGTRVVFAYRGRWARAKVIDRGPYIPGRTWDLTERLAKRLDMLTVGTAKVKAVVAP